MKVLIRSFTKIRKMGKLNLGYILLLFISISCSVEKFNLSPVGESRAENNSKITDFSYTAKKNQIIYSSEITNLIASFPKFKNDAVNSEVSNLKYYLKDYVGAMEAYNINGLNVARRKFEKSYKKLQKLRKYLNADDDQVLNRYLVRIKTNISLLESNIDKDLLSTVKN